MVFVITFPYKCLIALCWTINNIITQLTLSHGSHEKKIVDDSELDSPLCQKHF